MSVRGVSSIQPFSDLHSSNLLADILIINSLKTSNLSILQNHVKSQKDTSFFLKEHLTLTDPKGNTLLHIACKEGYVELVKLLFIKAKQFKIKISTFVNFSNLNGEYPLLLTASKIFLLNQETFQIAANPEMLEIILILLENGGMFCDKMNKDKWLEIFIFFPIEALALIFNQPEGSEIFYLESSEIDPILANGEKWIKKLANPVYSRCPWILEQELMRLLPRGFSKIGKKEALINLALVYAITDHCINKIDQFYYSNYKDRMDNDFIILNTFFCKQRLINFCLEHGADIWRPNPDFSPYEIAFINSDFIALGCFLIDFIKKEDIKNILEILGAKKILINTRDSEGDTLLHIASRNRPSKQSEAIIKLLISHGANPELLNNFGETPISLGIKSGYAKKVFAYSKEFVEKVNQIEILKSLFMLKSLSDEKKKG